MCTKIMSYSFKKCFSHIFVRTQKSPALDVVLILYEQKQNNLNVCEGQFYKQRLKVLPTDDSPLQCKQTTHYHSSQISEKCTI